MATSNENENEKTKSASDSSLDRLDRMEKLMEQMIIENKERSAEVDKKIAELVAEADKRSAEADRRSADADKRSAEYDRKFAELVAEADRRSAEADKRQADTEKVVKELSKNVGGISNSNGDFAEEAIYGALDRDMSFGGIKFDYIYPNMKKSSKEKELRGEFDVILENGDTIAIIETKYKVRKKDADKLVNEKLKNFRELFPAYSGYKIILGIGGMSFDDGVIQEANDNGIGVIKVIGEKVEIHTNNIKVY